MAKNLILGLKLGQNLAQFMVSHRCGKHGGAPQNLMEGGQLDSIHGSGMGVGVGA